MIKKKTTYFLNFLFLFISGFLFCQNIDFTKTKELLKGGNNKGALKLLKELELKTNKKNELANINFYIAKSYMQENSDDKAFTYFKKAKELFKEIDSMDRAMEINLEIADLFSFDDHEIKSSETYIKEFITYAKKTNNNYFLAKGYYNWADINSRRNPEESLVYYRLALEKNKLLNDDDLYITIYNNIAVLYNENIRNKDSALFYLDKSMVISVKNNSVYDICLNYMNQASAYFYDGNYKKSIELLHDADAVPITENIKFIKSRIKYVLSLNYEEVGDYENAYYSLAESKNLKDSLNLEKQKTNISEFQTLYKTREKTLQNEDLRSKLSNKNFLMYCLIGLFVFCFFIVVLGYKYINKRRLIAEQEKEIQQQKLEKTLKEQELHDIDLMLESQEYERQRIANELHDNLGSLIATIKLNFQNIRKFSNNFDVNKQVVFDTTDNLIDETYKEIRNIAHLKNLGVIGTEGLLVAVKNMASKMSVIDEFKVTVIPFGLKERFDNRIEVILFRIIQELCTNIIKHSKAKEITIYLTQHGQKDMNIIIEDNGIGFDVKNLKYTKGIGLKNIEKRIEQMGGTFTVDSIISKGTTVILEIPL